MGVPTAFGNAISFFDTGVAANGTALAAGVADQHYSILYSSDGGTYTATATAPNGAWMTTTDGSTWISPGASGNQGWNSGYYVYETAVDLTGYNAATAVISGSVAADDSVSIYLNRGGSAAFSGAGFSTSWAFVISSGFASGVNFVDFVVTNQSGPTGLLVDHASATAMPAASQTPEPTTLLLVLTGSLFVVGSRRLRAQAV